MFALTTGWLKRGLMQSVLYMLVFGMQPLFAQVQDKDKGNLRIQKSTIVSLFSQPENKTFKLAIQPSGLSDKLFDAEIKNHTSRGETSGVLNIRLSGPGSDYKMLVDRMPDEHNKLTYSIIVIDKLSGTWYKIQRQTDTEFILAPVPVEDIVTE